MEATFYYGIGALVVELRYISIAPQSEPAHVAAFRVPYYEKSDIICYVQGSSELCTREILKDCACIYSVEGRIAAYRSGDCYFFDLGTGDGNYITFMSYNKRSNKAYLFVDEDVVCHPHIMETTQMQMILIQYLVNHNGLLMHSSAIKVLSNISNCFTGDSGVGKTTISRLFAGQGYKVLTDETSIVWMTDGKAYISGTPWKGSNSSYFDSEICLLNAIYILSHGKQNAKRKVEKVRSVALIIRHTFPLFWDNEMLRKLVVIVKNLVAGVDVFEYAFVPNDSAVGYILDEH